MQDSLDDSERHIPSHMRPSSLQQEAYLRSLQSQEGTDGLNQSNSSSNANDTSGQLQSRENFNSLSSPTGTSHKGTYKFKQDSQ